MMAIHISLGDSLKRLALLTLAVLALAGCATDAPPASDKVAQYYESNKTLQPAPTAEPVPKISIAPGTKSVFFGDSWTAGYAAAPSTNGYAYLTAAALQWDSKVDAVSGTGYQNPGPGNTGNYVDRLAKQPADPTVQVLVLQGGLNDGSQDPAGFRQAVIDTLEVAREKFPAANIVILGPSTPIIPASAGLAAINSKLYEIAGEQKLNYIAPINEVWINADNYAEVIDTTAQNHPSTAGHAYLAEKTVAALRAIGS